MSQWNPLQDLMVLQDRMNRLFEDATQRRTQTGEVGDEFERADWTPVADIYETESGYTIAIDLPGIKRDAIEIPVLSLAENFMPIRGLSGASILGDGSVCLLLDVGAVVSMASDPRRKAQEV